MSKPRTYGEIVTQAARVLADAGVDSARLDARLLVGHVAGLDPAALLARRDDAFPAGIDEALAPLVARRAAREPMAHILGEREFWSLTLRVTADTLVPRPDTETLVEAALAWRKALPRHAGLSVLDFGTGTGCILLALLSEWPDAHGLGVDISEGALAVARDNARRLGLAERARFRRGDWGEGLDGRFDLIVSNPPYIPDGDIDGLDPDVARFEPRTALSGGADGLDAYRRLIADIDRLLAPEGAVFLEIGANQGEAVAALLHRNGLGVTAEHRDLAGLPRCLAARRASL